MDTEQLNNEYLGISEAAEYLRVSASTLRRWEKKGFLIPERTPTGIRRYTKKQLDDVIQAPPDQDYSEYSVHSNREQVDQDTPTTQVYTPITSSVQESSNLEMDLRYPADEVDALKDFFKKAGYDTFEETDPAEPLPAVANPVLSEDIPHTPTDDLLSDQFEPDISQKPEVVQLYTHMPSPSYSTQSYPLHPSVASMPVPELPPLPEFQATELPKVTQTTPSIPSETFHEEHSASFLSYMRKDREYMSTPQVAPPSPAEDRMPRQTEERDIPYTAPHEAVPSAKEDVASLKSKIPVIIVSVIALIVVLFIAWALYTYLSAPTELYNGVIE